MPHQRVLSNWHNLPFSRRTTLAGILKNPTVSLHCFRISAKHFTSFNEGEKHGAVRTTATKPRILCHWFFALCNSHNFLRACCFARSARVCFGSENHRQSEVTRI